MSLRGQRVSRMVAVATQTEVGPWAVGGRARGMGDGVLGGRRVFACITARVGSGMMQQQQESVVRQKGGPSGVTSYGWS